ncbi:HDOD domain-containing protein [Myxococcota bacterium]|nr:HDOD domain-containing protein [Myxococcota bacterium]
MGAPEELAGQMEKVILARIASDKLVLPSFPSAAASCLTLMRDPATSMKQVSAVLERDPLLVVQLVKVANASGANVRSVEQALSRVNLQKAKPLLGDWCGRMMYESRDTEIMRAAWGLWEHSVAVALLARDLAALSGSSEGETAFMTGLLHDVGKVVVAGIMLEAERMIGGRGGQWVNSDTWTASLQKSHRQVGLALAEKWHLPEVVVAGINDDGEYDSANRGSVVNFVRFANALTKVHGIYVGKCDLDDAQAIVMIGRSLLGLDDDMIQRLAADLKNRARAHLS